MPMALADPCLFVRTGNALDLPAVADLARISFDPHFREAWTEGQMAGALASQGGSLLLLERDNEIRAFALCRQIFDESELLLCAIHPEERRKGIGRMLMNAVRLHCQNNGSSRIFLEVRESNGPARALYEHCGYRVEGRRSAYYRDANGCASDAITLALHLNPVDKF